MALAYLAAFGCALCYGVGSILQDIAAKRVEADSKLDARLLVRVTTQLPYVGGLGLDLVGWVLSLLALLRLPLFAVQAIWPPASASWWSCRRRSPRCAPATARWPSSPCWGWAWSRWRPPPPPTDPGPSAAWLHGGHVVGGGAHRRGRGGGGPHPDR